jgi:hypothetical protein
VKPSIDYLDQTIIGYRDHSHTVLLELATSILNWETSPTELFRILTEKVGQRVARSAGWPKTLRRFGNELRRLAPQLRMHGLSVSFSKGRDSQLVTLVTTAFVTSVARIRLRVVAG